MREGRVARAATWARLRVTTRPGAGIDCEDRRPGDRPVGDKEPAQSVLVDPALAECLVEAAVAAGELWLEAERGEARRRDPRRTRRRRKARRARRRACEGTLEVLAERAQHLAAVSGHGRSYVSYRTISGGCPTRGEWTRWPEERRPVSPTTSSAIGRFSASSPRSASSARAAWPLATTTAARRTAVATRIRRIRTGRSSSGLPRSGARR